jgi:hypothetical protein
MNKLGNLVVLAVLALLGVVGYWWVNPHHLPRFIRDSIPGLSLPRPASPVGNFRPPHF